MLGGESEEGRVLTWFLEPRIISSPRSQCAAKPRRLLIVPDAQNMAASFPSRPAWHARSSHQESSARLAVLVSAPLALPAT